jgi:hypothetical protein
VRTLTPNNEDGFDIDYTGDMNEYRRGKKDLDDGLLQAYSIILSDFCTKRIEDQSNFSSKIENDPVELRAISTLSYSDTNGQNPLFDWIEQISRFLNLKQGSHESLSDYFKRFSQELDSFRTLFGSKIFNKACEKLEAYATAADTDKFKQRKITINTSSMVQIPPILPLSQSRGATMWYVRVEKDLLSNIYTKKEFRSLAREERKPRRMSLINSTRDTASILSMSPSSHLRRRKRQCSLSYS